MFSLLGPGTSTDGKGVVDLLQVPPPSQHRYPVELPPNKIGISIIITHIGVIQSENLCLVDKSIEIIF